MFEGHSARGGAVRVSPECWIWCTEHASEMVAGDGMWVDSRVLRVFEIQMEDPKAS